ncbi:hypothetical protein BO71DRAFT_399249 [Aspergillus ellipticus CBS 707.79]|uniref:Uncharacterized protein n=1 Tax=Aspergillus ellipticus CBS 707.79 TaxID=1448320 RepID=A0A319D9Z8_9EURO|nr:hypothetical protein BO71DRAFT_399249 [Aspergillus ellipticus CBS 707.79]
MRPAKRLLVCCLASSTATAIRRVYPKPWKRFGGYIYTRLLVSYSGAFKLAGVMILCSVLIMPFMSHEDDEKYRPTVLSSILSSPTLASIWAV